MMATSTIPKTRILRSYVCTACTAQNGADLVVLLDPAAVPPLQPTHRRRCFLCPACGKPLTSPAESAPAPVAAG